MSPKNTAVSTGFSLPQGTTSISSVDYAAMLPLGDYPEFPPQRDWRRILTLCTLALVLWNRRKLAQEMNGRQRRRRRQENDVSAQRVVTFNEAVSRTALLTRLAQSLLADGR